MTASSEPPLPDFDKKILDRIRISYAELLDATKHQDDKIGRLFTGIAFLTAAALALANLNSASYLTQRYSDWGAVPPAMLFLSAYLGLVLLSVLLLINSLSTPLRVPGLSRSIPPLPITWVHQVKASQLYFGEISKLSLYEWQKKWKGANPDDLDRELAQSLVGETHNLAVRTQFKYGRTTEATVLFNLALLSLSLTVVLCLTAASVRPTVSLETPLFPIWGHWAIGTVIGGYFFLQLQGQVRYSRQTVDEVLSDGSGFRNAVWRNPAFWRYLWTASASVWIFLVASAAFKGSSQSLWILALGLVGVGALIRGTSLMIERRDRHLARNPHRRTESDTVEEVVQWSGVAFASFGGVVLSIIYCRNPDWISNYTATLTIALLAVLLLTIRSLLLPTMAAWRNKRRFLARSRANKD